MNWRKAFEKKETDAEAEVKAIREAPAGAVVPVANVGAPHLARGNPLLQFGKDVVDATKDSDRGTGDADGARARRGARPTTATEIIRWVEDQDEQAPAAEVLFTLRGVQQKLRIATIKVGDAIEAYETLQSSGRVPPDSTRGRQVSAGADTTQPNNEGLVFVTEGMQADREGRS